jgi:hypothetical protein
LSARSPAGESSFAAKEPALTRDRLKIVPRRRLLSLVTLALLSLAVASGRGAIGSDASRWQVGATPAPSASPAGTEETTLAVVSERAVRLPDERILALSPDGAFLAVLRDRDSVLCVYDVAALDAAPVCADLAAAGIRPPHLESVVWSPDASRIALTEAGPGSFIDGDVWILDAATGVLTNLTDDGVSGPIDDLILGAEDGTPAAAPPPGFGVDALPAWSPDGAELAFSRTTVDGQTSLYRVSAAGGEARLVASVAPNGLFAVYGGLQWAVASSDGSEERLIFALGLRDLTDPANGIWEVEADGGTPRQLASMNDPELGYAILPAVSSDGDRALVFFSEGILPYFPGSPWTTIDLATGTLERLDLADPSPDDPLIPVLATFAPDGDAILIAARTRLSFEHSLAAQQTSGGEANVLRDDLAQLRPTAMARGLVWASNDTVFVPTEFDAGLLLTVGLVPATARGPVDPESIATGTPLVVNEDGVALRAGPSAEAEIVAELALGSPVIALGPVEEVDGFAWVPVRDPASGTIGYVRAEFLSRSQEP